MKSDPHRPTLNVRLAAEKGALGRLETLTLARLGSLSTNMVWTLASNIVFAAAQWVMLIVLARLGSAADVGQFALGIAVSTPVMLLASLSLRTVQVTSPTGAYLFGDYLALRAITTLIAVVAISSYALTSGLTLGTALTVMLLGVAKGVEAMSDILYGLQQRVERLDVVARSVMARGLAAMVGMVVGFAATGSVAVGAAGFGLAWLAVLIWFDIPQAMSTLRAIRQPDHRHLLTARWDTATLRRLAWLSLPFGVSTMLAALIINIPRYSIAAEVGKADLGIFAALAYLVLAGQTVMTAVGQTALPRYSRLIRTEKPKEARRLLMLVTGIGVGLGLVAVGGSAVLGEWVLALIYGEEYGSRANVLVWIAAATALGFVGYSLDLFLFAVQRFTSLLISNAAAAAATFAGCLLLVPDRGITGAAIAMFAASLVQIAVKSWFVRRIARGGASGTAG